MKLVHKQTLNISNLDADSKISALLPRRSEIVHVGYGNTSLDTISLWYEFETTQEEQDAGTTPTETRTVYIFGTGQPIPDDLTHRGTTIQGPFVWHLYEPRRG